MKPEPLYLQHIPEWVARRLDALYSRVETGSVTVHKLDGQAMKFEFRNVESAKAPE